jgi:periplasmic protein TonB
MNVDAWGLVEEDRGRQRRLAIGYAAGVLVIGALVGVAATVKAAAPPREEEEVLDVKLAKAPEPPPPAPPPPPPPTPVEAKPKPVGPIARKAIVAPTAVPTEAPPESDKPAKPPTGPDEYADGKGGKKGGIAGGDPNGVANGAPGGTGTAPAVVPPPPPPAPKGPIAVTEDMTPASPVSTPDPPVPAEARSQGISATVVVRFTITESGAVTNVTIARGSHPLLDPVILAAVRSWRYKPALSADGRPVATRKTKVFRYNFKI